MEGEQIPVFYARVTKSDRFNVPTSRPRPNRAFYARVSRGDESFVRVTKAGNRARPTAPAAALDYYGLRQQQQQQRQQQQLQQQQQRHSDGQRVYAHGTDADGRKVDVVCPGDIDVSINTHQILRTSAKV